MNARLKIVNLGIAISLVLSVSCSKPIQYVSAAAGYIITFDDDNITEWYSIKDLLEAYNVKATYFLTNSEQFDDTQIEQLRRLKQAGHEFGSHGFQHLALNKFLKNGTLEEYFSQNIKPSVEWLNENGLGADYFAYPGGSRNQRADKELSEHFTILRGVSESQRHGSIHQVYQIDDIYYKSGYNGLISGLCLDNQFMLTLGEIRRGFQRCLRNNEVIVFYAHRPSTSGDDEYAVNINFLEAIFKTAEEMGIPSLSLAEFSKLD